MDPTYGFEELGHDLARQPLAAQRALALVGMRLSPALWTSLSIEARSGITECGAAEEIDVAQVRRLLTGLPFGRVQMSHPGRDVDPHTMPRELAEVLGPWLDPVRANWASLYALDRYVLNMLATNPRLLWRALAKISQRNRWRGSLGLPAIDGLLARSDVHVGRVGFQRLYDPRFHDGRGGVLARAAGVRAARRVNELIDLRSEVSIGPVELEWYAPRMDTIVWQAHVSTVDGQFSVAGSLMAAWTAAVALLDMILEVDPSATISAARISDEPWLATGGDDATLSGR